MSIDIDGNDYWVWKAIEVIEPRMVIIEYNATLGTDMSVAVEYDPSFSRFEKHKSGWYHSASLVALEKLGRTKGYTLVGCDSNGVNAFFVKNELLSGTNLQGQLVKDAYYTISKRAAFSLNDQWATIANMTYVEIP